MQTIVDVVTCRWYRGAEEKATFIHNFEEVDLTALKDEETFSHEFHAVAKSGQGDFLKTLDAIDLSTINVKSIYDPAGETPYVPRAGLPFDESRISEKRVETATGSRPAFAPEKPLTRKQAIMDLQGRDFFRTPPSAGDRAWIDALLDGRESIGETELLAAVREAEERMVSEASGEK